MKNTENLKIVNKPPVRRGQSWRLTYERLSDFVMPWWDELYASEPPANERWVSLMAGEREAARCRFIISGARYDPVLGSFPHGQLDILALEVAVSMRSTGIGRSALQALGDQFPQLRLTALNDNAKSRKFWDGIGWIRYESPHAFMKGIDRVTYSES